MSGRINEVKLDTVERQDKYYNGQLVRRYGKMYKITRTVPEMKNGRPTGYYIVLGTLVQV